MTDLYDRLMAGTTFDADREKCMEGLRSYIKKEQDYLKSLRSERGEIDLTWFEKTFKGSLRAQIASNYENDIKKSQETIRGCEGLLIWLSFLDTDTVTVNMEVFKYVSDGMITPKNP